jgi:2,4-dichlorophenol 6-monooxygenase
MMMRNNVFCTSLAGRELGRLEAWATSPRLKLQHDLASPSAMAELTQEVLEPIMTSEAAIRGAHMRFDTELLKVSQNDDSVTIHVRDRLTGHEYDLRAAYLIGADGANSQVMTQLGLPLKGRRNLGASIGIGFRGDLTKYLEHRPGDMFWMVQPGHGILGYSLGSLRVVRPWDRWVGSWGYDPTGPTPDLSHEAALNIIYQLIGDDHVEVEIESISTWTMNEVYAERISQGRVFCVGDAIHRHPPSNGLGSNTSIQDSYNLAWKLAMTLRGQAGPALLDTFEQERQPVAQHLVTKTMSNMGLFAPVAHALGLTRHAQTQEELDGLINELLEPSTAGMQKRAKFRAAVASNVYLHSAIGGEHNLLYTSDAVIPDSVMLSVNDPELEVILGLQNGRRIPHVWLTRDQQQISSLDLCGHGEFTLLTGVSGFQWKNVVDELSAGLNVPITTHVIGLGCPVEDPYGDFSTVCLPDETGAILVRPDQVVAWHVNTMPEHPYDELSHALLHVLGRESSRTQQANEPAAIGEVVSQEDSLPAH